MLLSRVHISNNNLFPSASIDVKIHLSLKEVSSAFGLFTNVVTELKRVITNLRCISVWLVLVDQMHWKKRKINHQGTDV